MVTGSQQTDEIRMRRVDPYTAESNLSYGGKSVGRTRRVVSKDGQTMTITLDRTAPTMVHNVDVFKRVEPWSLIQPGLTVKSYTTASSSRRGCAPSRDGEQRSAPRPAARRTAGA